MKKHIFIVLFLATILSACSKQTSNNTTQSETKNNSNDSTFVGSFKELMGKNDSVKCVIKSTTDNSVDDGVYYIDGNTQKMRADIKTQVEEEGKKITINSSVIYDKNTMYSWGDNLPQGIKFTIDPNQANPDTPNLSGTPEVEGEVVDLDEKVNLDCQKWTVDNNIFTPPANVTFVDMAEKMKEVEQFTKNMGTDMCKMCANLPDKAECEEMYCQ